MKMNFEIDGDLAEAQIRLANLAQALAARFDPLNAACLLSAASSTVIRTACGDETAAAFFQALADEIRAERPQLQ